MENNNKKGWTGRGINRALPHLCQSGILESMDGEGRGVGIMMGCEGGRASQRGAAKGNWGSYWGNWGNWGCFLPGGSCQPSDSGCWSFPQSQQGWAVSKMPLWRWRNHILSIPGLPSQSCPHPGWEEKEQKGRGWNLLEKSWFNDIYHLMMVMIFITVGWRCFPKDNSQHWHQTKESFWLFQTTKPSCSIGWCENSSHFYVPQSYESALSGFLSCCDI